MEDTLIRVYQAHEAKVEITWQNQQSMLPDPVHFESTEGDIKAWVAEAIRGGGIPGIVADPNVNLQDFKVERFGPLEGVRTHNLITIRPKVTFG